MIKQKLCSRFKALQLESYKIQTLAEAYQLAVAISQKTPNPVENQIICELFYNAIEHGNLGIKDKKAFLLEQNRYFEEIERRLQLPENQNKYAMVTVAYAEKEMIVCITDTGTGFDYKKYLHIDENRLWDTHGRGIALVNSLLKICFNETGNQVCVFLPLHHFDVKYPNKAS